MNNLASQINKKPLPNILLNSNSEPMLLLPNHENTLLRNNYHIGSEYIAKKLEESKQAFKLAKENKDKKLKNEFNVTDKSGKSKLLSKKRVKLGKINSNKNEASKNKNKSKNKPNINLKINNDKNKINNDDDNNNNLEKQSYQSYSDYDNKNDNLFINNNNLGLDDDDYDLLN